MSRTRSVAVDTGDWSDPGFQGYPYSFQSFNANGYTVVTPPVPLRRADGGSETSLVVWQGGYVTFGTPSQAQIDFHQAYLAGDKRIFELPANTAGSSDFVATGLPINPVFSVCLQNSDYGYFIAWGDPIDASFSFDTERDYSEDCGELQLTGSSFSIDTGTDRTDYYDAYRFGAAVHDGAPPIVGTSGDNQLSGGNTPDLIEGRAGADRLSGGNGRDVFIYRAVEDSAAAAGQIDSITDFAPGVDRIDLRGLTVIGFETVRLADFYLVVIDTSGGRIAIRSAAPVTASDILSDRPLPESAGNKYLEGGTGNDKLVGGAGDDSLSGGDGNDTLEGGGGNDYLRGGYGTNVLRGGGGDDYLESGGFGDILDGGAGTDSTYLSFFQPTTFALTSDFTVGTNRYVSIEQATISGSDGNDTFTGGSGADRLDGRGGSNTLNGGNGDDIFVVDADLGQYRTSGIDIINGGNGIDQLNLSIRDTALTLSLANTGDIALGNGRSLRMNSIESIDFRATSFGSTVYSQNITGGIGNDEFYAYGNGNDTFRGGGGNDYFYSSGGNDTFDGGDGIDRVDLNFSSLGAAVNYRLGNGAVTTSNGIKTLDSIESAEISGSRFGDTLDGGIGGDRISGNDGGDVLRGGLGADTMDGGLGDDQLFGGDDNDMLIAGAGADRLDGGAGIDIARFYVRDQATVFALAEGVTVLTGQYGGDGTATLVSIEQVDVTGSNFDDVLTGGGFDDVLRGGGGDDVLRGGGGSDMLYGDFGDEDSTGGYDRVILDSPVDADLVTSLAYGIRTAEVDRLVGIEWITGGAGDDRLAAGLGTAAFGAADLIKTSAANGSLATALSIDGRFGTQRDPFVQDKSLPHATVFATGAGTKDYYSFTVTAGARAIFDIDATRGFDSYVRLFSASGALLDEDDDDSANPNILDPGSENNFDSLLHYSFATAGTYMLEVSGYAPSGQVSVPANAGYILNVSLTDGQVASGQVLQGSLLEGGDGNDTILSGFGDDRLYGGAGADTVSFERVVLPVFATLSERYASGGGGQDRLIDFENIVGSRANDLLIGDTGINLLVGGDGADRLSGEAGDDELQGGRGNDSLVGGTGADRMYGAAGDDSYIVDNANDRVFELTSEGYDTVYTFVSYQLDGVSSVEVLTAYDRASGESLRVTGNALGQTIYGNAGANLLDSGGGADVLYGLAGDDGYFVRGGGEQVIEFAGGGNDTVYAFGSFTLGAGSAVETITTYDRSSTGALNLVGNELANRIIGNNGINSLRGGGGADVLYGLSGDDSYVVDSGAAQVIEVAGGGRDTVYTTTNFTLGSDAEVEVLLAYDRAGTARLDLGGNGFGQTIYGNAGVNSINGGGGADVLYGLGGDDSFLIDGLNDTIYEFAGGGNDTVYSTGSFALLLDAEVETLTVYERGTANALNLTGSNAANRIIGNEGANLLDGKGGADTLYGMGGADIFAFSTALGPNNVDTVVGFVSGSDRIQLSSAIFGSITAGTLPTSAFVRGTRAGDANDRIIYDQASGRLFYDADGSGSDTAVLFANVGAGTALAAGDFFLM